MQPTSSINPRRSSRAGETILLGSAHRILAAIAVAAIGLSVFVAATPAIASSGSLPFVSEPESNDPSPESLAPGPSPAPDEPTATTITTDPVNFSGTGFARPSGTKQAGSGVVVTLATGGARLCAVEADTRATWACGAVALPNGSGITLEATETVDATDGSVPAAGRTTIDVLRPPVLDAAGLTTGLVSGTGRAGSFATVYLDGAVASNCARVPVSSNGAWSCNVGQPSGRYDVRARQSDPAIAGGTPSAESNGQVITVDRDAPASAVITSPRAGSRVVAQPTTVSGTGENGGRVDVYVDNIPVCGAIVNGGTWSCSIGEQSGRHALHTIQRDAAGNYGSPSEPILVFFGPHPTPTPTAPSPTQPGTPTPVPAPEPSSAAPVPHDDPPIFPGPDGSGPTLTEALTNWGTPTGFGSGLSWFGASDSRGGWYTAPLLGLAFLALIALPLRLLASALRGRVAFPRGRLTGRNQGLRVIPDAELPKPVNPWLVGAVPLAAAAGLVVLAGGVNGEVRYLRLFLAVGLGLTIINIVGGALATRLGSHWNRVASRLRFLPLMLLAAALAAIFSRWSGMEPPLVVGVLAGAVFAAATPVRERAMVNLTQVGVVVLLGLGGWVAHGLLGPVEGFWSSVASETLATLCLAGLGSALVLVLPLATLPGRVILEWSIPAWLGTVLVVASIVAAVVFGGGIANAGLMPWLLLAGAFTTLSLAVWAFVRFVEPQLV